MTDKKLIQLARANYRSLEPILSRIDALDGARNPSDSHKETWQALLVSEMIRSALLDLAERYRSRMERKAGRR